MMITPINRNNSESKISNEEDLEEKRQRSFIERNRFDSLEKEKIYIKSKIKDNYSNTNHKSFSLYDKSIIEKKISLSNVYNINNIINIHNEPINMSSLKSDKLNDNDDYYIKSKKINLELLNDEEQQKQYINMIILIQSFVRRFLSKKKYKNLLKNKIPKLPKQKKVIYKKKIPINRNNTNYNLLNRLQKNNFTNFKSHKNTNRSSLPNLLFKKNNINNSFIITKSNTVGSFIDKTKISEIQRPWQFRKNSPNISNDNKFTNYQSQSEIISKYNSSGRINLIKKPQYDSMLFNSITSLKDDEEEEYSKINNKDNSKDNIKDNIDRIPQIKSKKLKKFKNKTKKIEKGIFNKFNKFYSSNNNKRPKFIKLYYRNNKTINYRDEDSNDDDKVGNDDEDIYHYEVLNNKSFKEKTFTLFHDKNQNGNYIQQTKQNKIFKYKKINNEKIANIINNANKPNKINKGRTNKIIKSSKINIIKKKNPKSFNDIDIDLPYNNGYYRNIANSNSTNNIHYKRPLISEEKIKKEKNKEIIKIINDLKVWQRNKIYYNFSKEDILKFRILKPNRNFICINSTKTEKGLGLKRKKDIISKPNISSMKKINKNNSNLKGNSLKINNIKNNLLSKYFICDENKETNLILERKLIMKKPKYKNKY